MNDFQLFLPCHNILDGDTHKRSKSILKNKSDARLGSDPESERLLSDTGSGVSDISVIPVSLIGVKIEHNYSFLHSLSVG